MVRALNGQLEGSAGVDGTNCAPWHAAYAASNVERGHGGALKLPLHLRAGPALRPFI